MHYNDGSNNNPGKPCTNMTNDRNSDAGVRNWPVTLMLGLTFLAAVTVVPWYGVTRGFSGWAWLFFALFLIFNGVGIGSGYHRLWAHRAALTTRGPPCAGSWR